MLKPKLLSGRVKKTPTANVTSDRYDFLGLEQAEPNLGSASANGFVLTYNTNSLGNRLWAPGGLESNLAYAHANSAYNAANNATDTWVRNAVNAASSYANSAYVQANTAANIANTKYSSTGGTISGDVVITGNLTISGETTYANTGNISGDVVIHGNLTVSGQTTYANTTVVNLGDSIISLNADTPQNQSPSENAGIEVYRGAYINVSILWNEANDRWTFTNDGTNYSDIGSSAAESYANSAYIHANAAFEAANSANIAAAAGNAISNAALEAANSAGSYANSAFNAANSAGSYANSAFNTANLAFQAANSAGIYANSALILAQSAYDRAVLSGSYANSSFNVANSASSYANGAFAAANTKLSSSGGTISGDLTITGNLTVEGNTVIVNVSTLSVEDSLIQLAKNNTSDAVDIGFLGHYDAGSGNVHAGLIRRASDDTFYLFDNLTTEPLTNVVDIANSAIATLRANLISTNVLIRGYDPINHANSVYAHANAAFNAANTGPVTTDSFARNQANAAYDQANTVYLPSVTRLKLTVVGLPGSTAYLVDQYSAINISNTPEPTIYVTGGQTLAFDLSSISGFPLRIRVSNSGDDYNIGLTHVSNTGVISTEANAQGKDQGTLYWKVPYHIVNNTYVYQCETQTYMVGSIVIQNATDANSAYVHANSAFNTANTADQKAISAGSYANSAFFAANIANTNAISAGSYANSAYQTANSASSYANGAFAEANTANTNAISAGSYANGAYSFANTINTYFYGVNDYQNTSITSAGSHANGAFQAANSAGSYANGAFLGANAAYIHANAAFALANAGGGETVDIWARSSVNSASSYANSAYIHANAAFAAANAASGGGGGGGTTDSFARNQANAAYDQANTASGLLAFIDSVDRFTSNGSNTIFTLSKIPSDANNIIVYIDGVYQQTNEYSLTGSTLTLTSPVDANSILEVRTFSNTSIAHLTTIVNEFTGTGACTTFNLTTTPLNKNVTSVIVGGVPQLKSSYSITANTIVFSGAPANGSIIEVTTYKGGGSYATSFTSQVDSFIGTGACTTFTLSTLPNSINETFVYLNGVYQNKNTYSLSGANVVLTETATTSDKIEVVTVAGAELNVSSTRYNSRIYTANGTQSSFTISSKHSANSVLVFANGICQIPITDYTVSGTSLTFGVAPNSGTVIQIRELPV